MDKRYQVFISSTFTDLQQERDKVYQAVLEMDCIPAGMELFPALDEEQFEFIKKIIDDSDYYILIIGGRYGSISPDGVSYTEKEYDYAVSKGVKVIVLLHGDPQNIPSGKSESTDNGREKLEQFRNKASTGRLVRYWTAADQLPGLVNSSLTRTIRLYPAVGWIRGDVADTTALLTQINELRIENDRLRRDASGRPVRKRTTSQAYLPEDHTIQINYRIVSPGSQGTFSTTWKELFALIGPAAIARASSSSVRDYLEVMIKLQNGIHPGSNLIVSQYDFDTIALQFSASGLVDLFEHEPEGGEGVVFWKLTSEGVSYLTSLRVSAAPQRSEN